MYNLSKHIGKINLTKEKIRFIFLNESYEIDITTDKMMIKIVIKSNSFLIEYKLFVYL